MNHISDLYEVACAQPYLEALEFERAVRDWIPDAYRHDVPAVAEEAGLAEPVASHWYKLQLAHRRLWELPFNEGTVVIPKDVRVERNPLLVHRDARPYALLKEGARMGLSREQAAALRLFEKKQVLGEVLFERPEVQALDDARGFLAECLRKGLLIHQP